MQILFVCTGNICRSPLAECFTRHWAHNEGLHLSVSSAGTHALVGEPMDALAAQALAEIGGTCEGFTARKLTPEIARSADLIITMTQQQRHDVLAMSPVALRKAFTLLEAAQLAEYPAVRSVSDLPLSRAQNPTAVNAPDVPDPFRHPIEAHRDAAQTVSAAIPKIVSALTSRGDQRDG